MTDADFFKDLDNLLAAQIPPPLADGEFTLYIVMERADCCTKRAAAIIRDAVAAGQMEYIGKRRGKHGHALDAWRVVQKNRKD